MKVSGRWKDYSGRFAADTFEIGERLDVLLKAYDRARWPWQRWALKHLIFVLVVVNRENIVTRLKYEG